MATKMKKTLSLALALIMVLGMLPLTAFAADEKAVQAEAQINGGTHPIYYAYNEKDEAFETTGDKKAAVSNREDDPDVTISKTIAPTGIENEFDIQLKVQTNQRIVEVSTNPDAAVALVIDTSGSMSWCAECGEEDDHAAGCTYDRPHVNVPVETSQSRMAAAKKAAITFIEQFRDSAIVDGKTAANRYVSLVTFAKKASKEEIDKKNWVNLNDLDWTKDKDSKDYVKKGDSWSGYHYVNPLLRAIDEMSAGGSTNVAGGLKYADENLDDLFAAQVNNKALTRGSSFVLLLGDGEPTAKVAAPKGNYKQYSKKSDEDYVNAEKWARKIRNTDTKILSAYVGNNEEDDGYTWFKAFTNQCALAKNAGDLMQTFEQYITLIKIGAKAWVVTDPMGTNIGYQPAENQGSRDTSVTDNTLTWTLRNDIPQNADGKTLTPEQIKNASTFYYFLNYKAKLDSAGPDAQKYALTNGATRLDYYLVNEKGNCIDNTGEEISADNALLQLYFKVPQVKALAGELNFTKVAAHDPDTKLDGATFTLTRVGEDAPAYIANSVGGAVAFSNIASGYSYVLEETAAPAGYVVSSKTYNVAVNYGKVTAASQDEPKTSLTQFTNQLDPQNIDIPVTKTWSNPDAAHAPITVTLNKQIGSAAAVEAASAELNAEGLWQHTFPAMPTIDVETGNPITYSVAEAAVNGYTPTYGGNQTKGLTIHNTQAETTVLKVTKAWNAPESMKQAVTIQVLQNNTNFQTVTLNNGNNWTQTIPDVAVYDASGSAYTYSVQETTQLPGFTTGYSGSLSAGFVVTNTANQEKISVAGAKTWVDNSNAYETRPNSITVTLYKDGEVTDQSFELSEANNWDYSFTELDKYDLTGDGHEFVYTVVETDVPADYTVTGGTKDANGAYNLTNTLAGTTQFNVSKVWEVPADETNPEAVTVTLLQDGSKFGDSVELNATKNWEHDFTGLPQYTNNGVKHVYSVEETPIDGYTAQIVPSAEGAVITNTRSDTINNSGTKTWVDGNNVDDTRPESITVTLLANSVPTDRTAQLPDANGEWKYTFENVAAYDADGQRITYTVQEEPVSGYTTAYAANHLDITNTITQKNDVTISGTKTWVDNNNAYATRPASVTVVLYKNGAPTNTTAPMTAPNWSYTFQNLDRYNTDGSLNVYTVVEQSVPGYATTNVGFDFTNTLQQVLTELPVNKVWVDGENAGNTRGEVIAVLLRDGVEIDQSKPLNADNDYQAKFTELPLYSEDLTQKYSYTVKEQSVPAGYEVSYSGGTITNTLEQKNLNLEVSKTWVGPMAGRPESIQVDLYRSVADGAETLVQTIELHAAQATTRAVRPENFWTGLFENVPKYDENRKAYIYRAQERAVPDGYTVSYDRNGLAITNTIEQEIQESLVVTKAWEAMPADMEIPTAQVELLRDGVSTGLKETFAYDEEIQTWRAVFQNLDTYALGENQDGHAYSYTVREVGEVNGSITLAGSSYKVDYYQNDHYIKNTYQVPDKYAYRIDCNYTIIQDGVRQTTQSVTGALVSGAKDQVVLANSADYLTYNGREYTFAGVPEDLTVTLTQANHEYILTLNYERIETTPTPTPPPTPGTTYYGITVKYVDEAGKELSAAHTERHYEGYSYDVTDKTTLEIADYTIKSVTGDTLAGRLNGDKVITVVYAPVVVIPDEPVPEGGKPGEVILPDTEPPKNELPEELEDGAVPLDAAPKTGDTATLWTTLMAVSGFGLAALAIFKGKKKEEDSAE